MSMNPTPFEDLNTLLADFVGEARTVLGANLCGIYLQGSFALGKGDEHSDVDWIVVTERDLGDAELEALQAMHGRLFARPEPWAQHLEGSYFPRELLRRVDPSRTEIMFLDNGATRLEASDHCNTAVARWVVRERGITLIGPDPATLIDPVPAADLRAEGLTMLREYVEWAPEPTKAGAMSQWKQPYLVLTYCRILCLLEHGRVWSKPEGARWALERLDPEWRDLVQHALDERADPWGRVHRPADPQLVERTLAFGEYALETGNAIAALH